MKQKAKSLRPKSRGALCCFGAASASDDEDQQQNGSTSCAASLQLDPIASTVALEATAELVLELISLDGATLLWSSTGQVTRCHLPALLSSRPSSSVPGTN